MSIIVFDNRMPGVFNFNPRHVVKHFIVANHDVVTHANVDRRILDATEHVVFNQAVFTELREYAVDAGIDNPVIADDVVITGLPHNGIAFVMLNGQPLYGNVVTGVQNRVIAFVLAVEYRPLPLNHHAAQGDIVLIDIDAFFVCTGVN